MKLNQTLNPISFAERKKINENWEEIVRNIHLLDGKISILAGGKDVEEILKRIDEATDGALIAAEQAITATDKAIAATSDANSATSKANTAASKADTATTSANNKIVEVNQVLADADIKIKAAIKATDDAIIAKQNADAATSKANTSASKADVATGKATTATKQADEAAAKAIEATTDTLDAIAKAVEATKQAAEATEAAITATDKANESADKANTQAEYAKAEGDKTKALTTDLQKAHEDLMPLKNDVVKATTDAYAATSNANSAYEKIKGWGAATSYTQGTTYNKNNVVTFNGSTYQAKNDGITQAPPTTPTSNNDWILLAQRGVDGEGAVASVDGILPDGDGNVTLNHANKTDVATALNNAKKYTDEKIGSVDFTEIENSIADNTSKINAHEAKKDNPHSVTKSQVGLGNVDNVKQATKAEFDAHNANENNPHKVTKTQVGLGSVDNAKQATKVEFDAHTEDKTNPHGVTKTQVGLGSVQNYGLATTAESTTGTSNAKYMTPLRTKEAITNTTGTLSNLRTTAKTDLVSAVNEVFTNGNNVKKNTVDALLSVDDKLPITTTSAWVNIISSISNISTGKKWASGSTAVGLETSIFARWLSISGVSYEDKRFIHVTGLGFTPSLVFVKNTQAISNQRSLVSTFVDTSNKRADGETVILTNDNIFIYTNDATHGVIGNSFKLPVGTQYLPDSVSVDWIAIE